ncbi:hypothetical protein RJ640_021761 [Escallonia rubra]|uniref:Mitochondrial import inner membrane translocase subunit TIM50 n=1 Tax=Escallonia rubra TaxID=112253 RepID=A0AA88UKY0_9ASTE|nr:hypothetical protein RJ640_021761 [Escallonia rubra]
MSALVRSRLLSIVRTSNRRYCSSAAVNPPPKEPIAAAASSIIGNQPPPPSSTVPPPATSGAEKKSWSFLKYGLIAALTGGVATAGYVTYGTASSLYLNAYVMNHQANTFANLLQKFQAYLYSAAMTVPAKLVELYLDLRRSTEEQVRGFTEPASDQLLPDLHPMEQHVFTLVLDLNETLLYSDWKRERGWRTFKRPGVDDFLERLAQYYEIVVYSDQLNMDLSKLNRDPAKILFVSGNALESSLQPENSVPIKPWKGEAEDTALLDLIPFLEYVAVHRPADIRPVLASYQGRDIAKEFIERSKEYQKRMQDQKQHGRIWRR